LCEKPAPVYVPKDAEWFKARIGKTIYRDSHGECCATCDHVTSDGLVVFDESHATYLADIDADFAECGRFSNYRDSK
jgi:hypothetical protein